MPETFHDVACTVCGCVCDDLRVRVEGNRITHAEFACALAEPWFLEHNAAQRPAAEINGRAATVSQAINHAGDILRGAKNPLIYGLSRSSTDGQRAAVRLGDLLGANVDTTASSCHAPSIMAIQSAGESTCTLGEIKNRADLIVFWGVDPTVTHPRHMERYSVDATGLFIPRGKPDRHVVAVDVKPTSTTELADQFIRLEPDTDFEAINALRCLINDKPAAWETLPAATQSDLRELCVKMRDCRCGVIFFGLGLARKELGHATVETLLRLVTEMNAHTRFHARRMRIWGDVTGADSVLCWQTGFPFSVNLSRGYPRYNPGEYSANELLARREVDACLLVGSEGLASMSPEAIKHLKRIPTIALEHPHVDSLEKNSVRFTTAVYGIHLAGTAYRMDEVPIPLRPVLTSEYPSDAEVLLQLVDYCREPDRRKAGLAHDE